MAEDKIQQEGGVARSNASAIVTQWRERVTDATAHGKPLRLRGGGTKDWYGEALVGDLFDTREYAGIVAYDPAELVITARCGTPLAEIEAALAANQQILPFEPPHFGEGATFGGCVAAGLAGPRRAYVGAPRDFMLGAVLLEGHGKVLNFGGQVMKNVAGYDVARLMAGSLGTLGVVLEASVKVLPRPTAGCTLRFSLDQAHALSQMDTWAGQALPLSASAWYDGVLTLRLDGAQAAVQAAQQRLGGERLDDAQAAAFWQSLRERSHPFFTTRSAARDLWRVALPAATPPLSWASDEGRVDVDETLIEWGGMQRWLRVMPARGAAVRAAAVQAGGHATLMRRGEGAGTDSTFTPLAPALAAIHQGLKNAFDPARIFNRSRMYPDF
ncbi:glycolate oxidase subunit GlcE [Castellaniella sp. FW104-16D08]|uniref:glycolate oxidase subunit GlcE n=1 Tax=unclassified Castellaniella TaxID=2617606 RepID=UPI0033147277